MVRAISRPVFFLNVIREILFTPLLNTVVNDVMIALFLDNLFIFRIFTLEFILIRSHHMVN